ncbi:MAG: hypothetical protein KC560_11525 [Myxococcales bacterium]|nr:hypothetical protein [Myxococcales bacterium]
MYGGPRVRFLWFAAHLVLWTSEASGIPTLHRIGPDSPGGIVDARNVSADGSTVVGTIVEVGIGSEAFRWTVSEGLVRIGSPPNGFLDSSAEAVSSDGSVIIGNGRDSDGSRGFRWTAATGLVALPVPAGTSTGVGTLANDTSADGSVVAGHTTAPGVYEQAVTWDAAGIASVYASGDAGSHVYAVSADGAVLVGDDSVSGDAPALQVTRWTAGGGKERLGLDGWARGVTPNGETIVGTAQFALNSQQAFRWREGGFEPLGFLPGTNYSIAEDVSADGAVVVGSASASFANSRAFLWTEADGMRDLAGVFAMDYGLDVTGWEFEYVAGLSDDGRTLVGGGTYLGEVAAWVAVIPEPSTGALVASGTLMLAISRRYAARRACQTLPPIS